MADTTMQDIEMSLGLAGIHKYDCGEAWRIKAQKKTDMYLEPEACTCWVKKMEGALWSTNYGGI
jgi:hypothetical protein